MPDSITLAVCGPARPTEPIEPGGGAGQGQCFQTPKVPSPPVILGSLRSLTLEGCRERLLAGGPLPSSRRACVRLDSGTWAPDLTQSAWLWRCGWASFSEGCPLVNGTSNAYPILLQQRHQCSLASKAQAQVTYHNIFKGWN